MGCSFQIPLLASWLCSILALNLCQFVSIHPMIAGGGVFESKSFRCHPIALSVSDQLKRKVSNLILDLFQVWLSRGEEDDGVVLDCHRACRRDRLDKPLLRVHPVAAVSTVHLEPRNNVVREVVFADHHYLPSTVGRAFPRPAVVHLHTADLLVAVVDHRLGGDGRTYQGSCGVEKGDFHPDLCHVEPPFLPHKVLLVLFQFLFVSHSQPVTEDFGDGGITVGLFGLQKHKIQISPLVSKEDGVVLHLSDFILFRHFSFRHPVLLNIKLGGCVDHRDIITVDFKGLLPVDLCRDWFQPAVSLPVPHPYEVKHARMDPCHCWMDIFSRECLQGHVQHLVWGNLGHSDFPVQVATLGMGVQSWVPFGLVTQKCVCRVQADPTVPPVHLHHQSLFSLSLWYVSPEMSPQTGTKSTPTSLSYAAAWTDSGLGSAPFHRPRRCVYGPGALAL